MDFILPLSLGMLVMIGAIVVILIITGLIVWGHEKFQYYIQHQKPWLKEKIDTIKKWLGITLTTIYCLIFIAIILLFAYGIGFSLLQGG